MKTLSGLKRYQKLLLCLSVVAVLSATGFYIKLARGGGSKAFLHVSEMEVSLLQCRRAEKNFLMRHDRASRDRFARWVQALRKHEAGLRSVTKDKTVLGLLDDIRAEIATYENAFQDIKGLYDSTTFGPMHDSALLKITDEVSLMAEPVVTPSSMGVPRSLIEAARNLEYYVQLLPAGSAGLIVTLNLRRWEKNLQKTYDESGSGADSKGIFCRRKTTSEISKLRDLIETSDSKVANAACLGTARAALQQYELNFKQFVANQDACRMKKKVMIGSARKIENSIQMIKTCLAQDSDRMADISCQMEIAILQCRRAEKNFLLRHDWASADNFSRGIQTFREHQAGLRSVTKDKTILSLLEDIHARIAVYENSFQDIKGLYDSTTFGPVHDPALSKITDEATLMAEPAVTPSSVDATRSLIGAARNLEYYINISAENSTPLVSVLQARRWEKNFRKRYDRLTSGINSMSMLYIRKIEQEMSKIRDWLDSKKMKGRARADVARLRLALDRYKFNLAQIARNVDAFYVKKKQIIDSARHLERSVQMIKGKVLRTRAETDIDGLYYLSPKLPVHSQPGGNYHDVGSLVGNQPSRYGYRHCKNWMQFYFDQDGRYTKEKLISSIYFHIWIRTVNNSIDVGYERDGNYSGGRGGMDHFIPISYDASKGYSARNGCSLITGKVDMNCPLKGDKIYKFAIKLSRHSSYPSIVMEPNQYSFIIINPACDSILKSTDSDSDGLNDYEEMFVYHSNPHDEDTDNDGFSDRTEALKGTSANINDLYSGRVIAGVTDTPHIDHHENIDGDWIVDKEERYANTRFTLHGNLTVRGGGCLTLDNCILDMNRKAKNKHIHVDKGSTLTLKKTKVDLNETGYWYKIVEGGQVEVDSEFDVYGTLNLEETVLENGLGIKIHQGSKTNIRDSHIRNCYHISYEGASDSKIERSLISTFIGIPLYCKSSSPIIRESILSVEYGGIGAYCFGSSPSISNSKIHVCEDEDSDSSAFILVENSHPVLSGTNFNARRVRLDKTSAIVFK